MRKIIHVDLDAFYASVEQLDRPELKGLPVVVGGTPNGRGVVATASYEARRFGVRSAMPSAQAARLCPKAVFVRPRFERYKELSTQIRKIFQDVTDLVEPLSLDEAYLDVTENLLGEKSATQLAKHIRQRIESETGLTASAGVAPVKFLAKIASDLDKPNGLTVIPPEKVDSFLESLPVKKIWGVGPATQKRLMQLGLHTAGDIRRAEVAALEKSLGKHGRFLFQLAWGKDNRKVKPSRERKSRGAERTFSKDLSDWDDLLVILTDLCDRVGSSLKKEDLSGRTITVKLRYNDFRTITRSQTVFPSVQDPDEILVSARMLLFKEREQEEEALRLLGVSVSGFEKKTLPYQLELFNENN